VCPVRCSCGMHILLQLTMSHLVRMALVRRSTHLAQLSRSSLASLPSLAAPHSSTVASAPSVCYFPQSFSSYCVHINCPPFFFLKTIFDKKTQHHRHPRPSARSGRRPATSVRRNLKSTPSLVRNAFIYFLRLYVIILLTKWRWHAGISSEGYSGKGFVTHK
jgi:hypothetical protein